MIAEHEATAFTRVGMEIDEHFEALVLFSLLNYGLPCGPDCRVVALGRCEVHAIQIAGHRVQTIVPPRDSIRVQNHDYLEDIVLSQTATLLILQTVITKTERKVRKRYIPIMKFTEIADI